MSLRLLAQLAMLATLATACARPVLYYPATEPAPAPQPVAVAVPVPAAAPVDATSTAGISALELLRARQIIVPVAGASMNHVADSFDEARDGGDRVHRAIDILAPRGTPILSADDGRVLRMSTSTLGGITMYTTDSDGQLVYYYAHMERYHELMEPGRFLSKGDTIGYVGTTGNAPKDTPHLHFQVMRMPADGKYWNGEPINPYSVLGGVPRTDRGKHAVGMPLDF